MPTPLIRSFAKRSGKSVSEVDKMWQKTKAELYSEGHSPKKDGGGFYGMLVSILEKKLHLKGKKKKNESIVDKGMDLENPTDELVDKGMDFEKSIDELADRAVKHLSEKAESNMDFDRLSKHLAICFRNYGWGSGVMLNGDIVVKDHDSGLSFKVNIKNKTLQIQYDNGDPNKLNKILKMLGLDHNDIESRDNDKIVLSNEGVSKMLHHYFDRHVNDDEIQEHVIPIY